MLQVGNAGSSPATEIVCENGPRAASSAGLGSVGPWTKAPGSASAARSTAPSQPGVGAQSSSVNATSSASVARQPSSRAVAGPPWTGRSIVRSGSVAAGALGGEDRLGGSGGAVGDHDHLVGGPLLLGQRAQQLGEPGGPIVRADDDRDRRSHGWDAYQ